MTWFRWHLKRKFVILGILSLLTIAVSFAIMLAAVEVLNADLYGRLTETARLGRMDGTGKNSTSNVPTVRLVLHRVFAEENTVEASLIMTMNRSLLEKLIAEGDTPLTAVVRDGSSYQPFGLSASVTASALPAEPGLEEVSTESERFKLPSLPSLAGFPFDDIQVYPIIYLIGKNGRHYEFEEEVQKELPGRLLTASMQPPTAAAIVTLTRSWIEKTIVLTSATIFLLICITVLVTLFKAGIALSGVEQILTLAGFLVAAAEFRNVLDFPKTSGTSALEIAVIALPLLALAFGFALSAIRGMRKSNI